MFPLSQRWREVCAWALLVGVVIGGGYATLVFLGVPSHFPIFLSNRDLSEIMSRVSHPFLVGLNGLLPFLRKLLGDARPFLPYAIVSAVVYAVVVGVALFRRGQFYVEFRVRPITLFLLFLASVWCLFTTLSLQRTWDGSDPRLLTEPTADTVEGNEGLIAARENFQRLLDRGCLDRQPGLQGPAGTAVYQIRLRCLQGSLLTRVLSPLPLLLWFVLVMLVLGRAMLWLVRLRSEPPLLEFTQALFLGAGVLMTLLWLLALLRQFSALPSFLLLGVIPLLGYRHSLYWLRSSLHRVWVYRRGFAAPTTLLVWLLFSYLAFNYLTVIRPFPIGWDDLGRYLNTPRLISSYGFLITGMMNVQWEFLSALGFVLFGFDSTFGATLAMEINWMAGVFAILIILAFAKSFLGPRTGTLSALLYYTLPMVGHFSFADMKTDNAVFAFGIAALLSLFLGVFGRSTEGEEDRGSSAVNLRYLFLAGILAGVAFGVKATTAMLISILLFILFQALLGVPGFLGGLAMVVVGVSYMNFSWKEFFQLLAGFTISDSVTALIPRAAFLLAVLLLLAGLWRVSREHCRTFLLAVAVFLGGMAIAVFPWTSHNVLLNGRISIATLLNAPDALSPDVDYQAAPPLVVPRGGARRLPPDLALDPNHPACKGTAKQEELDRYWGYGRGVRHYLGLPWRLVMNLDSQGYYLTLSPLFLLFPLLFLLPFTWERRWFFVLVVATLVYLLEFVLITRGIPWYAITLFFGLVLGLEVLLLHASTQALRFAMACLLALSLATAFSMRLWQFRMQRSFMEYAWGKSDAKILQEATVPDYDNIVQEVMRQSQRTDRPYLYRVGTFISYFIPRNREIIAVGDHQLVYFNCLNQEQDHQLTLRRLQALGFHSMIVDTNTTTIEQDPNGTLHQKFNKLVDFLNDPAVGIVPVVSNPSRGVVYVLLP